MNEKLRLRPSFMIQSQGGNREINFGTMFQFVTSHELARHENAVYAGLYYRWDDAIVLASRMDFDKFYLTMSYDINTSALTTASSGRGGLEVSLAAAIFRKHSKMCASAIDCPVF